MFTDLEGFGRALLQKTPSVALITWRHVYTIRTFVDQLAPVVRKIRTGTVVSKLQVAEMDRKEFSERLLKSFQRRDSAAVCLLIYEIESLAASVGKILNGYRERLSSLRATVLAIRENRQRDLFIECPDLLDWVGPMVGRAEDLGSPLSLETVRKAISRFEKTHGMTSTRFQKAFAAGDIAGLSDAWEWNELLAIESDLADN